MDFVYEDIVYERWQVLNYNLLGQKNTTPTRCSNYFHSIINSIVINNNIYHKQNFNIY